MYKSLLQYIKLIFLMKVILLLKCLLPAKMHNYHTLKWRTEPYMVETSQ